MYYKCIFLPFSQIFLNKTYLVKILSEKPIWFAKEKMKENQMKTGLLHIKQ